jgi:hypothetical protein
MIFSKKNECQLTSTFSSKISPQYHMPGRTCQFNFQGVNWHVVLFFTSHTTCQILNCACKLINVHFMQILSYQMFFLFFLFWDRRPTQPPPKWIKNKKTCQLSKTCKSFVKKLHANPHLLMPCNSTAAAERGGLGRAVMRCNVHVLAV